MLPLPFLLPLPPPPPPTSSSLSPPPPLLSPPPPPSSSSSSSVRRSGSLLPRRSAAAAAAALLLLAADPPQTLPFTRIARAAEEDADPQLEEERVVRLFQVLLLILILILTMGGWFLDLVRRVGRGPFPIFRVLRVPRRDGG